MQQRLYRHHVERLLSDLDKVELHKSTWIDAQRLMASWGRWGHWEGNCSAQNCRYDVLLEDASARLNGHVMPDWVYAVVLRVFPAYYWLGGRPSTVSLSLLIKDGYIVRTGLYARVEVPPDRKSGDQYGYGLIAAAVSVPRLARSREALELERDPYYLVVRPGGCEICMEAVLVYSDYTPFEEIRRISRLNVSCFAGGRQCQTVEDLLPSSEPFHLYDGTIGGRPETNNPANRATPHPCAIPTWALGRDASGIILVEGLGSKTETSPVGNERDSRQVAQVRILSTLKGALQASSSMTEVVPFHSTQWDVGIDETIDAGKQYFVMNYASLDPWKERKPAFGGDRCSTVAATPGVREELLRGMALDDELGVKELPHFPF